MCPALSNRISQLHPDIAPLTIILATLTVLDNGMLHGGGEGRA
jgi:hypothetical protein